VQLYAGDRCAVAGFPIEDVPRPIVFLDQPVHLGDRGYVDSDSKIAWLSGQSSNSATLSAALAILILSRRPAGDSASRLAVLRAGRGGRAGFVRRGLRGDLGWDHAAVLGSWSPADESALDWIKQASHTSSTVATGFDVGDLPDSILVLHRMYERVDGRPIPDGGEPPDGDPRPGWIGPLTDAYRRLTWREYAHRRGIDLIDPDRWPFTFADDGIDQEANLNPPSEGSIDDVATWKALTAILTAHSPEGPDTWCTAYYFVIMAYGPLGRAPNIYRGRLGDADDLIARPEVNYNSPHNLWPDDHSWVLHTDYDAWYTKISGTTDLIQAIANSPDLETLRSA
jgi:hypothetical protein